MRIKITLLIGIVWNSAFSQVGTISPEEQVNNLKAKVSDSIKYDLPVFKEEIKTGVYASYEELKNNSPSLVKKKIRIKKEPRDIEPWLGTYNFIPRIWRIDKRVEWTWGFANEGKVYVFHQGEYFPLIIQNGEIYFYGYGIPGSGKKRQLVGALVGGAVGAILTSFGKYSIAKRKKVKYYLNPVTGDFDKMIVQEKIENISE